MNFDDRNVPQRGRAESSAAAATTSFFPDTRNARIQGGHFSDRGHHVNIIINPSNLQPAENEATAESGDAPSSARYSQPELNHDTRSLNQISCEIYYRHMAAKRHGSPLWIPQANNRKPIEYRRIGVQLGDIGIITTFGSFDFLFNIFLLADHPIQPRVLPRGFTPLELPIPELDINGRAEFDENSYLASSSIEHRSQNDNDLTGLLFEYSNSSEGAVLAMPHGLNSEDLSNIASVRQYLKDHLENIYGYVNGRLGREVKNGDVRLVIGCDKTTAWGMATFVNSVSQRLAQQQLRLRLKPMGGLAGCSKYEWECSGMVDSARSGPGTQEFQQLRIHADSKPFEHENQCLFVRTLNGTLADDIWNTLVASKFVTVDSHETLRVWPQSYAMEFIKHGDTCRKLLGT